MPKRNTRATRRAEKRRKHDEAFEKETAEAIGCSFETAQYLRNHCGRRREELEFDLLYHQPVLDLWRERAPEAQLLASVIEEFLAEVRRHREALRDFAIRLGPLITVGVEHVHLDSPENLRPFVRERILAPINEPPAEDDL